MTNFDFPNHANHRLHANVLAVNGTYFTVAKQEHGVYVSFSGSDP